MPPRKRPSSADQDPHPVESPRTQGPSVPPAKQREERRAEWNTQRRQVIKVPGGAVLRGCKKTKRKLMAHFQPRARSTLAWATSGCETSHPRPSSSKPPPFEAWFTISVFDCNECSRLRAEVLMRVIKADVRLGRSCQASWSAQFQPPES
ncbi:hypothetical protein HaLaN_11579 [Haematococcus lacustris]|uniref:Uncharacterized protein n=1 Tax=Haematococcus lacustris TaxID=44745 RepID=A0A699YYJ3_HAELA|nr:hypothetical protein HaLaN_11579 [Haematococcus lacustris]